MSVVTGRRCGNNGTASFSSRKSSVRSTTETGFSIAFHAVALALLNRLRERSDRPEVDLQPFVAPASSVVVCDCRVVGE